jgi:hypothetical protein
VRYYVNIETRNIGNILKIEELLACWCADVDLDLIITLNVGTAVANKNGIDSIELLKGVLIESVEIIININRRAVV